MKNDKKRTMAPFFLVAALLLGVIGLTVVESCKAYAAPVPVVGMVDYTYLINNHPDTPKANETLQAEQDQAKKEYAEKSVILNDKGKQDLELQLNQRVEQKRQELLKPIVDKINVAIKEVADVKGLTVVVFKNTVAYGGLDITLDIANKLNGK